MSSASSPGPEMFELRVLDGAQQGARSRVPTGRAVSVGAGLDSDIVLRGADLGERRITLTPRDGGVQLAVLAGDAGVGERRLQAGEQIHLPLRTPVHLGSTVIGVGPDGEGDWSLAAEAQAQANTEPGAAAEPAAAAAPEATAASRQARARPWWQGLIVGGGGLAAVSIGMLAFAYTAQPAPMSAAQRAARAEAVLHGAGLARLVAKPDAAGDEIIVTGYLETAAQRARAEQVLDAEGLPARLQVWVNDQVASAVLDVYRVNGVTAQAQSTGPGAVTVNTHEGDAARLDEIRTIARRDVPGLAALEVRNVPPPPARAPAQVVNDPGKRVSAIVPGDPSYVVTADGTRYFEGALLPTGHRIAGIAQHQVLLEKDGEKTPLTF